MEDTIYHEAYIKARIPKGIHSPETIKVLLPSSSTLKSHRDHSDLAVSSQTLQH
jgi:hypothetical protein